MVEEVTQAIGCGQQVVRRLVKLGVLRTFTEVQHLDLDRHRLAAVDGTSPEIVLRPDQSRAVTALCAALDPAVASRPSCCPE